MNRLKSLSRLQLALLLCGALLLLWGGHGVGQYLVWNGQQAVSDGAVPAVASLMRHQMEQQALSGGVKALLGLGLLGGVFVKNELDARRAR